MTVLAAARAIASGRHLGPVRVAVEGGMIAEVTAGRPRAGDQDLGDVLLAPGFVDLHCHGGDGGSFSDPDDDAGIARARSFHRRHGTTTLLGSLVSGSPERMGRAAANLAASAGGGDLAGVHFEGPFLSVERRGAHDPRRLADPEPGAVAGLLEAAAGWTRVMTLAPERAGGLEAVAALAGGGVVPAIGHTDAGYELTLEAVRRGARLATHLYNGMRPLHHRDPGPVPALLASEEVVCELIVDGAHLHPAVVALTFRLLGPHRVALVTDAVACAGLPDGTYPGDGGGEVVVRGGRVELGDGSSLAGSTLTTDAALRNAVASGVGLVDALAALTATPARVLGVDDRGVLDGGRRADIVVLDAALGVRRVMEGGTWVTPRS